jgi:maltooligosyltrehalose trehalohydrolase
VPSRRLPIGAELQPDGNVHVRVWAPKARQVHLVFERPSAPANCITMDAVGDGYYEAACSAQAGDLYRFRLDGSRELIADPASRYQPQGPFGPSVIVDPSAFRWTDASWRGVKSSEVIAYEFHVGTFTSEGTWRAAMEHLPALADLGITMLEMMPVGDFAGDFGWGYDGVNLFAPTRLYGAPDDLRAFVDRAHELGIGVVLDVVYNHVGPSGAFFHLFSDDYFSARGTEWGQAINFDGAHCGPVREFFLANAGYWIDEFHFDGLRLDATQSIADDSQDHIVAAIRRRVAESARGRLTWVVAENERQEGHMVRPPSAGGYGLDALWNDDFHHSAIVALTGRREAYYTDYLGQPQEFVSAAKHGFLYQGQWYRWQKQRRGRSALDLPPASFVAFVENHDQLANSATGMRLHQMTSPGRFRALTGLLLLGPWIPMLFQGQEFNAEAPFLFFADHSGDLGQQVRDGRAEFLRQFHRVKSDDVRLDDPGDVGTFERSKLTHDEHETSRPMWFMHRDLVHLRRDDPTLMMTGGHGVDGTVLGASAFAIRLFGAAGSSADRLLVVNLGGDLEIPVIPDPLLAPPDDHRWAARWSSEDRAYGGAGILAIERNPGWFLPAESTTLLSAERVSTFGST